MEMAEIVGMWPGNGQGMSSGDAVARKGGQMGELGEAIDGQWLARMCQINLRHGQEVAKGLSEGVRSQ